MNQPYAAEISRDANGQFLCAVRVEGSPDPVIAAAATMKGALHRALVELKLSTDDPAVYARAFKIIRMRRRLSLKDAAHRIATTQANIERMEKGTTVQSTETWKLWTKRIGVSEADLKLQVRDLVYLGNE